MVQALGYSQRLPLFARDLAARVAAFEPTQQRFEVYRELLTRSLRNRAVERPLWHAQYAVSNSLAQPSVHYKDALAFADSSDCNVEALARHAKQLCSAHYTELFVHGNVAAGEAAALGGAWLEAFPAVRLSSDCAPLPSAEFLAAREVTPRGQ